MNEIQEEIKVEILKILSGEDANSLCMDDAMDREVLAAILTGHFAPLDILDGQPDLSVDNLVNRIKTEPNLLTCADLLHSAFTRYFYAGKKERTS